MITFVIGLAILFIGGGLYGAFCQKVFCPDDRKTPVFFMLVLTISVMMSIL